MEAFGKEMAVKLRPTLHQLQIGDLDVRRLDLDEYHRMIEIGLFDEDERVELIGGVLHRMSPRGPQHGGSLKRVLGAFIEQLGTRVEFSVQDPITIPSVTSEPEPDLVLAKPRDVGYFDRHPLPEEVLLLVEVADSSLEVDQEVKLPVYAAAGIEDYWIVNLVDGQVEVHREPEVLADGMATYQWQTIHKVGDTVTPLHFPDCMIEVAALLPQ